MAESINIQLNGDTRTISADLSLLGLLQSLELDERAVVVELNREIIRKNHLAEGTIKDGDQIELVHFVGGG
jgi:sulfur carrier protein